jgi:hypothetical protein
MSTKFEIDLLEERIAPSTLSLLDTSVSGSTSDSVSATLPVVGTVSVDASGSGSVGVSL